MKIDPQRKKLRKKPEIEKTSHDHGLPELIFVKITILPQVIYKFVSIIIKKNPQPFSTGKIISNFLWRHKRLKTARADRTKRNTDGDIAMGGIIILDFKLYFKAMIIKPT